MTKKNPCLFRNYILYGSHFTFTNRHRFPVYRKQIVTFVLVIAKAFLSYFAIKQEIYEGNILIHITFVMIYYYIIILVTMKSHTIDIERCLTKL